MPKGPSVGRLQRGGGSAAGFFFRLNGLAALQRQLEDMAGQDMDEEMEQAAEVVLKKVLAESKAIVPKDTWLLHDSAFVSVVRTRGRIQAAIGYDTDYALFVHENPDAYHAPPTRWKYLEEPFVRNIAAMEKRIAAAAVRAMERA